DIADPQVEVVHTVFDHTDTAVGLEQLAAIDRIRAVLGHITCRDVGQQRAVVAGEGDHPLVRIVVLHGGVGDLGDVAGHVFQLAQVHRVRGFSTVGHVGDLALGTDVTHRHRIGAI